MAPFSRGAEDDTDEVGEGPFLFGIVIGEVEGFARVLAGDCHSLSPKAHITECLRGCSHVSDCGPGHDQTPQVLDAAIVSTNHLPRGGLGCHLSRRSTPERLEAARRAATRNRLIGERMTPETVDARISAWDGKAAEDGIERSAHYWEPRGDGSPRSGSATFGLKGPLDSPRTIAQMRMGRRWSSTSRARR